MMTSGEDTSIGDISKVDYRKNNFLKNNQAILSIIEESKNVNEKEAINIFTSRIQGKRFTLANLDRSRPQTRNGSLAQKQISKRNKRLIKKAKQNGELKNEKNITSEKPLITIPFTKTQRKKRGLEEIDKELNFNEILPIHKLWKNYMKQLIGLQDENLINSFISNLNSNDSNSINQLTTMQNSILKSNFIGGEIKVIQSINPSFVGLQGLIIKETELTFSIISKSKEDEECIDKKKKIKNNNRKRKLNNNVKIIPKINTIFQMILNLTKDFNLQFNLYGNQLLNGVQTRSTKKFKQKRSIELKSF